MINIILYQPEKPLNTGNIMRTAVAIGAHLHIIGPLTYSIDDKSLKRAGMDYIEHLKMTYYDSLEKFFKLIKEEDIFYVTRYSDKVYSSFDFSNEVKDYYLMFGKESTGIPKDILKRNENHLLRIPMVSNNRSLNLSNSVAIIVYEVLRQQNFPSLATNEMIKGTDFLKKYSKK